MASRKDNHKVMDMLEKMGMVKKIEDEDEQTQAGKPADTDAAQPDASSAEHPAAKQADSSAPRIPDIQAIKSDKTYGVSDKVLRRSFWDDEPVEDEGPDADRFMEIEELYRRFSLRPSGVDTVYLLEEYIRTLPESLPPEMRRSIVLKIVSASGFDFDKLLNDGIDRVSRLNDYSATFAAHTEEVVARYNEEIDVLQRQIESIKETINERKNLHKRQFLEIEGEAQRLKDILDFITK